MEFDGATRAAEQLSRQRDSFRREGAPDLAGRQQQLDRLLAAILAERETIAEAISTDYGHRAPAETLFGEILVVVNAIRHARRHLARWMRPEQRRVGLNFQPASARILYQPLGVIGILSPWNYPFQLAIAPLVDALAAGNRVMLKPSELTPATGALMRRLLAGLFDETIVSVVEGGPDIAAAFSALPFDHLLFTGSTAVGRQVMRAAAEHLTPVTLELGGKSPVLLSHDFPLLRAARSIAQGKCFNAGQTCIAPDYVLAPRDQVEALAEAMLTAARDFYPTLAGNPDYSAIISKRHYERLVRLVEAARDGGARVLQAAEPVPGERKMPFTIILDAKPDMDIMSEEIFGPVLPIIAYRDLDQAIAQINANARPLALYCYTNDRTLADRVLNRTLSGGVTLNGTMMHCAQPDLPFGGVGPSGQGAYHGQDGFKRFSHARGIFQIGFISGFEWLAPPYGALFQRVSRWLIGR